MSDLPTITDAVLDQWEASATTDEEAERTWSIHPLAVLAVVADLRAARRALGKIAAAGCFIYTKGDCWDHGRDPDATRLGKRVCDACLAAAALGVPAVPVDGAEQ